MYELLARESVYSLNLNYGLIFGDNCILIFRNKFGTYKYVCYLKVKFSDHDRSK